MIQLTCGQCGASDEREPRGAPVEAWAKALGWVNNTCPACAGTLPIGLLAWSWSAVQGFEACPRKHNATRVAKTHADPPGPQIARGRDLHRAFELGIKRGTVLPEELTRWQPVVDGIREQGGTAETKLALTQHLTPTGYFAGDVWLRSVADARVQAGTAIMLWDWKTGTWKEDAFGQLELTGAAFLLAQPEAEKARAAFVWLDAKQTEYADLDVVGALRVIAEFRTRLEPLVEASQTGVWEAKPGWNCKFCPVRECKFNKR